MAVKYEITRYSSTGIGVLSHVTRKRANAAHDQLYRAVYEMLEGAALLDRPVAVTLINAIMACEVAPPPRGHYRSSLFYLYASPRSLCTRLRGGRLNLGVQTMNKYELVETDTVTSPNGGTLFRIRALRAIISPNVNVGDLGGYVEKEANLTQVFGNAQVCDKTRR